ncbi:DUF2071 domain-containing protein [Streptomyces sp. NPDC056387]|uniref:DUF2071 domain-containing protein n=1 Tax=Streptomyces sp. NPDC056387 TaxID=3345803 RepID=UPI0035E2F04B
MTAAAPDGPDCHYTGRHRPSGPEYDLVVRNAGAAAAGSLDLWLTERFHAYSLRAGHLWRTPVRREPWPLRKASVLSLAQSLTRAPGLPGPCAEPLAHTSLGVGPVALGPARPA